MQSSIAIKEISVIVYKPAPVASPIIPLAHKPAEVVRPFIWLRELKSIELPLIIATATIDAAEIIAKPSSLTSIIDKSIMDETADAIDTRITVLSPAECLLLERSQPTIAARMTARQILNSTE